MVDSDADPKQSFAKIRRNLILLCLFLFFYQTLGLEFEKINLLGNVVDIEQPDNLIHILYLFFAYFIWRYHTACNEVHGTSLFKQNFLSTLLKRSQELAGLKIYFRTGLKSFGLTRRRLEKSKTSEIKDHVYGFDSFDDSLSVKEIKKLKRYEPITHNLIWITILYVFAFIEIAIKQKSFSEFILPYLMAAVMVGILMGAEIAPFLLPYF
jgi:hypothetical protein